MDIHFHYYNRTLFLTSVRSILSLSHNPLLQWILLFMVSFSDYREKSLESYWIKKLSFKFYMTFTKANFFDFLSSSLWVDSLLLILLKKGIVVRDPLQDGQRITESWTHNGKYEVVNIIKLLTKDVKKGLITFKEVLFLVRTKRGVINLSYLKSKWLVKGIFTQYNFYRSQESIDGILLRVSVLVVFWYIYFKDE